MKKLKANLIVVKFHDDGTRVEKNWEDVPDKEQDAIKQKFTEELMVAAGYMRVNET